MSGERVRGNARNYRHDAIVGRVAACAAHLGHEVHHEVRIGKGRCDLVIGPLDEPHLLVEVKTSINGQCQMNAAWKQVRRYAGDIRSGRFSVVAGIISPFSTPERAWLRSLNALATIGELEQTPVQFISNVGVSDVPPAEFAIGTPYDRERRQAALLHENGGRRSRFHGCSLAEELRHTLWCAGWTEDEIEGALRSVRQTAERAA